MWSSGHVQPEVISSHPPALQTWERCRLRTNTVLHCDGELMGALTPRNFPLAAPVVRTTLDWGGAEIWVSKLGLSSVCCVHHGTPVCPVTGWRGWYLSVLPGPKPLQGMAVKTQGLEWHRHTFVSAPPLICESLKLFRV